MMKSELLFDEHRQTQRNPHPGAGHIIEASPDSPSQQIDDETNEGNTGDVVIDHRALIRNLRLKGHKGRHGHQQKAIAGKDIPGRQECQQDDCETEGNRQRAQEILHRFG